MSNSLVRVVRAIAVKLPLWGYTVASALIVGVLYLGALPATPAQAEGPPAPGFAAFGYFGPTNLPPGTSGKLTLDIYNIGGAPNTKVVENPVTHEPETVPVPVTVTDRLPEGLTATGGGCPVSEGGRVVTCQLGVIQPAESPTLLYIPVSVAKTASGDAVDDVEVSGGGALEVSHATVPVIFSSQEAGLGFANFAVWLSNPDGTVDTQAGSHPNELTVAFAANNRLNNSTKEEQPTGGEVRDLDVKLPAGLVGNPNVVPQCSRELFDNSEAGITDGEGCPAASNLGFVQLEAKGIPGAGIPLFNLVPPPNDAAQFAFSINGDSNVFLDQRVRSGGDDGITSHTGNVPQREDVFFSAMIWGVPSAEGHRFQRGGAGCIRNGEKTETGHEACVSSAPREPFLTLPTSCQGPQEFVVEATGTWQNEHITPAKRSVLTTNLNDEPAGFTGCTDLRHFEPSISIAPDTTQGDTPAGLAATVKVPQEVNPGGLATSGLKNTTVVLPEGVAINPGQATGLQACQPAQENVAPGTEAGESEAMDGPPSCPAASKVGEDEVATPLLPDRLKGSVYVLQSNPPDLKLLVAASGDGVNLKLVGTVHLNEATGRLETTFENTPDAPLDEFVLKFSGGAQAALVTPALCQVYTTGADFAPWSGLQDALVESRFGIDSGPNGTPCANPLPFTSSMVAGATTDQAGGYTDFSLLLTRPDGQQRIEKLQFKAPEGLSGMISQVPLCGEPQAQQGTCSASSQIGHAVVGAGPGPYQLFLPEAGQPPAPIYLTGPYKGAPFGLSIVVPLIAGPFNLGTIVTRAKIEVDPHTAQIMVTTDPLPQIVDGIPTDLRSIDSVIDRPGFMFNPTNCDPQEFSGTATSAQGAVAPLSSHFQVGSCQSLKFAPDFKVSTQGRTSRADGASLTAKIVYPTTPLGANQASSQANIATVKVDLPKQLPSRLTTLQKACTAAQFEANPAGCPPASVVGHAKVITPILPVPLEGPAYFVSHGGEAFPSLIIVLQGYGVTVDLVGTTFISKAGITSSTFKSTPDVPFSSFELTLPEGRYSALAANGDLCTSKLAMPTAFVGQNGAVVHQSTKIAVTGCSKAKKKSKKKKQVKAKKSSSSAAHYAGRVHDNGRGL